MCRFRNFAFLFIFALWLPSGLAQNVTQWRVPDSANVPLNSPRIRALTFSPDGSQLVVAGTSSLALYDTYTGEVRTRFPGVMRDIAAVALSPDKQTVASAGIDAVVSLWDAPTGEHSADLIGHTDPVVALAFSPDGHLLASGSFKEIRLWYLSGGQTSRVTRLHGHRDMVTTLAFSPDSSTLASTSFYGTILLWDVQTGHLRHTLSAQTDSILTLAFSPDGQILASGGYWRAGAENTIHIWHPHTGRLLTTFEAHTLPVFTLAFSSDVHRPTLASAGWDNTIRLWDPRSRHLQATFEEPPAPIVALTFLSDAAGADSVIASASLDGTIQLHSLRRMAFRGDVNGDGVVNILDVTFIVSRFGENSPDLNGDGIVNILDVVLVANQVEK